MSSLIVPIQLDALVLGEHRDVIGPDVDFARLPWSATNRDHNPDTPNLMSAASPQPFQERLLRLSPGTHLHWSLPDGLTKGANVKRPWTMESVGELFFPAIPNRWWVVRRSPEDNVTAAWQVESDFVHPKSKELSISDDTDRLPVTFPDPKPKDGAPPYIRLGRALEFTDEPISPTPASNYLPARGSRLTALGFGNPNFAALYANCRSILGLHDRNPVSDKCVYEVFGWYAGGVPDPLKAFSDHLRTLDNAAMIERLNGRKDAKKLPIDADIGFDERAKAERLLLNDAFGWDITHSVPDNILCYGLVEVDPQKEGPHDQVDHISEPVAIGHSGVEAFSSLVSEIMSSEQGFADKNLLEEQLEALRLSYMYRDQTLDIGRKFEEARHTQQFHSAQRQKLWAVRPIETSGEVVATGTAPELPHNIAFQLNALNEIQHTYDMGLAEIDVLRQRLFDDWALWMQARYRRDDHRGFRVDVNATAQLIERDLTMLKERQAAVGFMEQSLVDGRWVLKTREGTGKDALALRVMKTHTAMKALLDAHVNAETKQRDLHLVRVPGPRFWKPKDPVVLLTHPLAQPTTRHGHDGLMTCRTIGISPKDFQPTLGFANEIVAMFDQLHDDGLLDRAVTSQGRSVWTPFSMEWRARVAPAQDANDPSTSQTEYDPYFVQDNYKLAIEAADLAPADPHQPAALHRSHVSGRCLLSPHADRVLQDRIEAYLDIARGPAARMAVAYAEVHGIAGGLIEAIDRFWDHEAGENGAYRDVANAAVAAGNVPEGPLHSLLSAWRVIHDRGLRTLSQSLGGFVDALAGHHQELQIPVADPLGFEPEQQLSNAVAEALGDYHHASPFPDNVFQPLISGEVMIEKLRLIDTFGKFVDWTPSHLITSETLRHPHVNRAALMPRLAQPARLAVDWLSAEDDQIEMTGHPTATPICGWLMSSRMDHGTLSLHDAQGRGLGQIDAHGHWQIIPGTLATPAGPGEIGNPHMASLAHWLTHRHNEDGFMRAFTTELDEALDAISPVDFDDPQSRALFSGRPMAVVRMRIKLELLGRPLASVSWPDLIARLNGALPNTHGFDGVEFPVRIGEHGLLSDGVVGFWVETGAGDGPDAAYEGRTFWSPQPKGTRETVGHPDIQYIDAGSAHPKRLYLSADQPDMIVTMLLDPRAAAHITTGILPAKTIRLHPEQYREAFGRIGITIMAMPVLTSDKGAELPVPVQSGGEWVWIEKHGREWIEIPAQPHISRDDLLSAYPETGAELWIKLTEAGWLKSEDDTLPALFVPPDPKTQPGLPGESPERVLALLSTLHDIAKAIGRPVREARYNDKTVAREGWLQFRPEPLRDPPP